MSGEEKRPLRFRGFNAGPRERQQIQIALAFTALATALLYFDLVSRRESATAQRGLGNLDSAAAGDP